MFGGGPKLTLGRLNGIPVRLDTTFIMVPLVFFTGLPSHLHEALWPAAIVGTAGVFLSILVHELGHAEAARVQQVGVTEIVVGGFFGYATLRRQAIPRKVLIRILAAGPFANLLLFLALWLALTAASPVGINVHNLTYQISASLGWQGETVRALALVNLAMFVFNMLPAFPLDGGRILGLLLDRRLSPRLSLQIVSVLGVAAGVFMVLFGLGISLFLAAIGVMIVVTNLRRLRRRPTSRTAA